MIKNFKKKEFWIKAGFVLILVCVLYGLWCRSLSDDVIWKNVTVNGVSVKGMTMDEAKGAIEEEFQSQYQDQTMTVTLDGKEYSLSVYPVLGMDADKVLEDAYSLGHGSWILRGIHRIRLMNLGKAKEEYTISPSAMHPEKLDQVLADSDLGTYSTVHESVVVQTAASLIISKGSNGQKADLDALKEKIREAIDQQDFSSVIDCPVMESQPDSVDFDFYYDQIYRKVQNASLDADHEIVPSVIGVTFDVDAARKRYEAASDNELIIIPLTLTQPAVTTSDIEALPYLDILGSYTTYGGGTPERITNLRLAVAGINGIELMPGETFSYNEALGPRTAERGYQEATVIVNGKHDKGLGGGICQISSTLFVASLYANMNIVERHFHAARVDYSVDGLDAAIVWGNQDFRFTNVTSHPVRISASYVNGAVNVILYGTKENENEVRLSVEHQDENSCTTYRSVFDADGELLDTEQICTSHYQVS